MSPLGTAESNHCAEVNPAQGCSEELSRASQRKRIGEALSNLIEGKEHSEEIERWSRELEEKVFAAAGSAVNKEYLSGMEELVRTRNGSLELGAKKNENIRLEQLPHYPSTSNPTLYNIVRLNKSGGNQVHKDRNVVLPKEDLKEETSTLCCYVDQRVSLTKEYLRRLPDSAHMLFRHPPGLGKALEEDKVCGCSVSGRSEKGVLKNLYKEFRQQVEMKKRKLGVISTELNYCT